MSILDQVLSGLYKPNKQERQTTAQIAAKPTASSSSAGRPVLPNNMPTPGELLRGEVVDLRLNQISVLLENGILVAARTEGTLPLSIGQKASFFVAQTTDSQITLKLAKEDSSAENPVIDKALQAAGLQKNERTIGIVTALLEHQQPVTETSIRHYMMLSAKYPELPVKDFVLMELHQIPVNDTTVSQFSQHRNGTHQLLSQLDTALTELWNQFSKLPEGSARSQFISNLRSLLIPEGNTLPQEAAAPSSPVSTEVPVSAPTTSVTPQTPIEQNVAFFLPSEEAAVSSGSAAQADYSLQPEKALTEQSMASSATPAASATLLPQQTELPSTLFDFKNTFLQNFLLKPEQLSEQDSVSSYYERLEEQVSALRQLSKSLPESASQASSSAAKQVQSNLSFMDAINHIFPYVQLPLLLKDKPAHGELYVYERKKTLSNSESLSALLHLDLEALGTTDIFVTLRGTSVSAKFFLTDTAAKQLVSSELPSLTDALSQKGYALQSEVTLRESKPESDSLLEQFLEENSPSGLHRYTFDIRA